MNTPDKPLPKYFKPLLAIIFGIPLIIAILFTEKQWPPATYAISWLTGKDGKFPEKTAILLNFVILLLGVLVIALVLLMFKKIFIRPKSVS